MDGFPTTARAVRGFIARCGHDVPPEFDYIVKRPGLFYCSPACADADTTEEITIRLQRGQESLSELLYGVWGGLFWLVDNRDGTYSLHGGGVAREQLGEAFMRVMLAKAEEQDPLTEDELEKFPPAYKADPSLEVEEWMEKIRIRLGWRFDGQEVE